MILYHFTNHRFVGSIRHHGIRIGRIVLDYGEIANAISLTTDASPEGLGINLEDELATDAQRQEHFKITGRWLPQDHVYWSKVDARITVEIPTNDQRLVPWAECRHLVEPVRLANMERDARPETWWVYVGTVPPSCFRAIHYRHGAEYLDHLKRNQH
jgi:hypothetical protein